MKWLAVLLLLGFFIRHMGVGCIAAESHMTQAAVFYILGGFWEVVLCSALLLIAWGCKASIWRNLTMAAMGIGISEGLQVGVCRMCISDIKAVPTGVNLCDYLTGLPIGISLVCLYFFILCWSVGHATRAA